MSLDQRRHKSFLQILSFHSHCCTADHQKAAQAVAAGPGTLAGELLLSFFDPNLYGSDNFDYLFISSKPPFPLFKTLMLVIVEQEDTQQASAILVALRNSQGLPLP